MPEIRLQRAKEQSISTDGPLQRSETEHPAPAAFEWKKNQGKDDGQGQHVGGLIMNGRPGKIEGFIDQDNMGKKKDRQQEQQDVKQIGDGVIDRPKTCASRKKGNQPGADGP